MIGQVQGKLLEELDGDDPSSQSQNGSSVLRSLGGSFDRGGSSRRGSTRPGSKEGSRRGSKVRKAIVDPSDCLGGHAVGLGGLVGSGGELGKNVSRRASLAMLAHEATGRMSIFGLGSFDGAGAGGSNHGSSTRNTFDGGSFDLPGGSGVFRLRNASTSENNRAGAGPTRKKGHSGEGLRDAFGRSILSPERMKVGPLLCYSVEKIGWLPWP